MNNKSMNIKVGLFIVIVLAVFLVGQLWLNEFRVARSGYVVKVFFNDVGGLRLGDPVRVFGIKKGKVVNLEMKGDGVLVTLWIEKDIILKEDVEVSIQDVAMISGTKTIVIDPGRSDKIWDKNKIIQGKPNLGMSTIEVGTLASQFQKLVEILKGGVVKGKITLAEAEKTVESINLILQENRGSIKNLINSASDDADTLKTTLKKLNKSLSDLKIILDKVNRKEGTLGKLIYDDALYKELLDLTKELKNTVKDFRENPKRYINIKVL